MIQTLAYGLPEASMSDLPRQVRSLQDQCEMLQDQMLRANEDLESLMFIWNIRHIAKKLTHQGISGLTLLTKVVVPLTYEVINHPAVWTSPLLRGIKETYEETNKYLGRNDFIEDADQSSESLQIPLGRTQTETVSNDKRRKSRRKEENSDDECFTRGVIFSARRLASPGLRQTPQNSPQRHKGHGEREENSGGEKGDRHRPS